MSLVKSKLGVADLNPSMWLNYWIEIMSRVKRARSVIGSLMKVDQLVVFDTPDYAQQEIELEFHDEYA
jgi:hypothetical protein